MIRTRRTAPPKRTPILAPQPTYDEQVRQADGLRRRGDYDAAVKAFHALAMRHPQRSDAHANLAAMLQAAGHPVLALQSISRALELDPRSVAALLNSAEIMKDFGEWAAVRETYDAALALQPDSPQVHFARALHLLTLGEWAEGWREHESRWRVPDLPLTTARLTTPLWDGALLDGQRILLDHEQGLGDQIMCARFAPMVAARGGFVIVRCSAPLEPLLAAMPGVHKVVVDGATIPAHDVRASLMSLPLLLGINSPDALDGSAYLRPVGECPAALATVFSAASRRVGLVWSGNPQHRNDARRSIAPRHLVPLLRMPGVQFASLQRHDGTATLPTEFHDVVHDLGGALHTFNDTAHLLLQLDLLVTVDTSVAHLAGALGVPTLLLVPFVPDWRWMVGRNDTPWYDSVTLVRQDTLFEWAPVITRVRSHLHTLTGTAR
jgi:hypothetical protein